MKRRPDCYEDSSALNALALAVLAALAMFRRS